MQKLDKTGVPRSEESRGSDLSEWLFTMGVKMTPADAVLRGAGGGFMIAGIPFAAAGRRRPFRFWGSFSGFK